MLLIKSNISNPMDERTKVKEIAKKVTESRKSAQEFLKAAGIMTPEGELSSDYIA